MLRCRTPATPRRDTRAFLIGFAAARFVPPHTHYQRLFALLLRRLLPSSLVGRGRRHDAPRFSYYLHHFARLMPLPRRVARRMPPQFRLIIRRYQKTDAIFDAASRLIFPFRRASAAAAISMMLFYRYHA